MPKLLTPPDVELGINIPVYFILRATCIFKSCLAMGLRGFEPLSLPSESNTLSKLSYRCRIIFLD